MYQKTFLVSALIIFLSIIVGMPVTPIYSQSTTPTTYYVLGGGAGNCSGSDWANAAGRIPSALIPGDVVYIGNSGINLADPGASPCAGEASHTFSTSGTAADPITIKAATQSDHGTSTGWKQSYAADVTPGIMWSNSDTPYDGLISPFWKFCGSYYVVNGEVGNADATGTYGFYFKSAGRLFGFVMADSHACNETSITNLSFSHVEINGVDPNSTVGGTEAGGTGFYLGSPVSTTATVGPVTIDHSYIHDIFGPISSAGRVIDLTVSNSYIERNFSDAAQHSNAIDTQASGNDASQIGIENLDVYDDVFQNIQGTGDILCLNGVCNGWKIYNSVFYYTSDWDSVCEYGDATASCGVSKVFGDNYPAGVVTNSVFYGNTIAHIHLKPGQPGADNAGVVIQMSGSTGNIAENNLWYDCTIGDASDDGSNGKPLLVSHDYNTLLNTGYATMGTVLASHEFQIGGSAQTVTGTAADPFVNDNVTSGQDSLANFHLTSETVDPYLNDGVSLPAPYNVDFAGNPRPGSDGTWERGALQFVPTVNPPPSDLHVVTGN